MNARPNVSNIGVVGLSLIALWSGCGSYSQRISLASGGAQRASSSLELSSLTEKKWTLVSAAVANSGAIALGSKAAYIQFDASGGVSGHSGCNGFNGTMGATASGRISVSNLVTTLIGCSDAPEALLYSFLSGEFDLMFNGSSVILTGSYQAQVAQLVFQIQSSGATGSTSSSGSNVSGVILSSGDLVRISGKDPTQLLDPRKSLIPIVELKPIPVKSPVPVPGGPVFSPYSPLKP